MHDFRARFTEGVHHFNSLHFWDAHESWEELWLDAETDLVEFLQGLIQIAAAYHHCRRGTLRGAVRLFDAGLKRLSAFPLRHCGVDRAAVEAAAREHRGWAAGREQGEILEDAAYPKLVLLLQEESPMPPSDPW